MEARDNAKINVVVFIYSKETALIQELYINSKKNGKNL